MLGFGQQNKAERVKTSMMKDTSELETIKSFRKQPAKNPLLDRRGFIFKKEDFIPDIEGNLMIDLQRFISDGKKDPNKAFLVNVDAEAIVYIEQFLSNKEALSKNRELYKEMLRERIESEGLKEEVDRRVKEGIKEEWEKRVRSSDDHYEDEADRTLQDAIDENNNI